MFKNRSPEEKRKLYRDIGIYSIIPTMMVVGPVVGYLIGKWVENRWGNEPWPTTIGALFGFLAAARETWLILTRHGRKG